jgi:hypothetical protein
MGPPTLSLRIRRSQVRVLPSALLIVLQIPQKRIGPGSRTEAYLLEPYCNPLL